MGATQSIICLQEIPRWTAGRVLRKTGFIVHSSGTREDEAAHRDGFDCGFLIPEGLNPRVRDEQYGRYWAGIVLDVGMYGHVLFLSLHFIHRCREEVGNTGTDLIDELRAETTS